MLSTNFDSLEETKEGILLMKFKQRKNLKKLA